MAYQNVASVLMFFPFVQLLLTQYPMRYGSVSCIINQLKIKGFYLVFSLVFFPCRLYFIWTKEIENEWKRLEFRRNMYSVVDSGTGQMQSTQLTRKKTNRITSTTVCLVIPLLDSFVRSLTRSFYRSYIYLDLMQSKPQKSFYRELGNLWIFYATISRWPSKSMRIHQKSHRCICQMYFYYLFMNV